MINFQDKKDKIKIFHSWPFLVLLCVILVFFIWGVFRFTIKMVETSKNRRISEIKNRELQETKNKLEIDIQKLQTEKGLEENIRERFGLGKVGEGLIVVVDDKNLKTIEDEEEGNWFVSFFRNWFK